MNIVVVWASNNPEKFWNKIVKDLLSKGHTIMPVNPNEAEIEGIKTYPNPSFIDDKDFEIINFVTPPEITLKVLKFQRDYIKDKKVWCQPGSSDEKVKEYLEQNWFSDYITDSCIMKSDLK